MGATVTASNFKGSLTLVLASEGGFANHPADNGKATMYGVTQGVYDAWRLMHGLRIRPVAAIDLGEVAAIYQQQYWQGVRGDQLPTGVDYAVFDFAVNSGVGRASQMLQTSLGVVADGHIGAVTLAKLAGVHDCAALISRLTDARETFVRSLSDFKIFGNGWLSRVDRVENDALKMLKDHAHG